MFRTEHGLISWYPGSSCGQLATSLTRLLSLLPTVHTVLPGHNMVITGEEAAQQARLHLAGQVSTSYQSLLHCWVQSPGRVARKACSRVRASLLLWANARARLPDACTAWIAN